MVSYMNKKKDGVVGIGYLLLPICIFLYAFRKVNLGVDLLDTGYHLSNYLYMEEMDPMWVFSTYIATILGNIFTKLPYGDTLIGINIYTSCIPAIFGVCTYVFYTKLFKMNRIVTFIGCIMALSLSWAPTTCIYHYLTYFFFSLGAMFLYKGLVKNKKRYLFLAGIILGINIFVRLPNLAEMALIVTVFIYAFYAKIKWKDIFNLVGICALGYLTGIIVMLAQIQIAYGIDQYIQGILRMMKVSSSVEGYSLFSMIFEAVKIYINSIKWLFYLTIPTLLGMLGFMVLPKKFIKIKIVGYSFCFLILIRWLYGQGLFSLVYDSYGAIINLSILFLMIALIISALILIGKNFKVEEKVLASVIIIIIAITPLGSNNVLYSNYNNMYLIMPFIIHYFMKFIIEIQNTITCKSIKWCKLLKNKQYQIFTYPIKISLILILLLYICQTWIFGGVFVFNEGLDKGNRDTVIEQVYALQHMKTNKESANKISEAAQFLKQEIFDESKLLMFGDIPAAPAYFSKPFIINPWTNLESYAVSTFEEEIKKVDFNKEDILIVTNKEVNNFLTVEDDNIAKDSQGYKNKVNIIKNIISQYEYSKVFENDEFVIYANS